MERDPSTTASSMRAWALALAVALPLLWAFNLPPSPTLLNECVALGLWGAAIVCLSWRRLHAHRPWAGEWRWLGAALMLTALGVIASIARGLPLGIAIGLLASLLAAMAVAGVGAAALGASDGADVHPIWIALAAAGALSAAIGCVQVFLPELPDGEWIARSGMPGRAVGNLRQPNHLSSLLLIALISLVALRDSRRLRDPGLWALGALQLFALVLTASRTGILGVIMLALWGLLDRRLSRRVRVALLTSPVLFAALWFGLAAWAHATAHAFSGEGRLAFGSGDISSSRFAIWSNTL